MSGAAICGACLPHHPKRHEECIGDRYAKRSIESGKPWSCACPCKNLPK